MSITTIFMLFGGLGFFLYGMKMMSEGLEKAAGAKMRSILEFFTKNRFIGMVVGIIFTAIIILLSNKFFTFNMLILSSLFTSTIILSISIIYIFVGLKINNLRRRIKI